MLKIITQEDWKDNIALGRTYEVHETSALRS